jgi:hypothetical protein
MRGEGREMNDVLANQLQRVQTHELKRHTCVRAIRFRVGEEAEEDCLSAWSKATVSGQSGSTERRAGQERGEKSDEEEQRGRVD